MFPRQAGHSDAAPPVPPDDAVAPPVPARALEVLTATRPPPDVEVALAAKDDVERLPFAEQATNPRMGAPIIKIGTARFISTDALSTRAVSSTPCAATLRQIRVTEV